jgi:hypothetical protein
MERISTSTIILVIFVYLAFSSISLAETYSGGTNDPCDPYQIEYLDWDYGVCWVCADEDSGPESWWSYTTTGCSKEEFFSEWVCDDIGSTVLFFECAPLDEADPDFDTYIYPCDICPYTYSQWPWDYVCAGDFDNDDIPDENDNCPDVPNSDQTDSDGDGYGDVCDDCPNDPDNDADNDGVCADVDGCPNDSNKIAPGQCGCGKPETDSDSDGTPDCICSEIIENAVHERVVVDGMAWFTFTPNFNLTLTEAAQRCGFHHFNWIQWCIYNNDPIRATVGGVQPDIPYLDPPHGGWDYHLHCGGNDFKNGYWDEDGIGCYPRENYTSTYELEFQDKPCVSDWIYHKWYKTALAGVRSDGTTVAISSYIVWGCSSKCADPVGMNIDTFDVEDPNVTIDGIYPISDLEQEDIDFLYSQGIEVDPNPCSYNLAGDSNYDCRVDLEDIRQLSIYWLNQEVDCPPSTQPMDLNDDCWVNLIDLAYIHNYWLVDCNLLPINYSCTLN